MDLQNVATLLEEALANINITIVIVLLGIGFIIKHVKFLEKISNDLIPLVLIAFSFLFTFLDSGVTVQATIASIITAAAAIGLHQQGKHIFVTLLIPKLNEIIFGKKEKTEETNTEEVISEDKENEENKTE